MSVVFEIRQLAWFHNNITISHKKKHNFDFSEIFVIFEYAEIAFVYVKQRIENFRLDRRISNTMVKNFDTAFFCMSNLYKRRGTKQPISFGVEKLDGYIVDATEETIEGEELEVEDENNNVVAHFSGFGIRYKRTASVIPLVGATAPLPGDSFKIGENFEFIVKSVKKSRARKDVEKWDLEGTYYPEVPMEEIE